MASLTKVTSISGWGLATRYAAIPLISRVHAILWITKYTAQEEPGGHDKPRGGHSVHRDERGDPSRAEPLDGLYEGLYEPLDGLGDPALYGLNDPLLDGFNDPLLDGLNEGLHEPLDGLNDPLEEAKYHGRSVGGGFTVQCSSVEGCLLPIEK